MPDNNYAKVVQLQREYDVLFQKYKQQVTDYMNVADNSDVIGSIRNAQYNNAMPNTASETIPNVNDAVDCATRCKGKANACKGATYNATNKTCYISDVPLDDSCYNVTIDVGDNFYAILPEKKRLLVEMRKSNLALQAKLQEIIAEQQANDALGTMRSASADKDKTFEEKNNALKARKDELDKIQRELDQNEEKEATSNLEIQRSYYTFIVVLVLFLLIVFMFFRFFSGGAGGAGAGAAAGFQAGPGINTGTGSSSGGMGWFGTIAVIVLLLFAWNYGKYFISVS